MSLYKFCQGVATFGVCFVIAGVIVGIAKVAKSEPASEPTKMYYNFERSVLAAESLKVSCSTEEHILHKLGFAKESVYYIQIINPEGTVIQTTNVVGEGNCKQEFFIKIFDQHHQGLILTKK